MFLELKIIIHKLITFKKNIFLGLENLKCIMQNINLTQYYFHLDTKTHTF